MVHKDTQHKKYVEDHEKTHTSLWAAIAKSQIKGEIKERNEYRRLLDECLYALNALPDQRLQYVDGGTTYKLASKIEQAFNKFDVAI